MMKNDAWKGVENDRGMTLKIGVREHSFEEAVFAQNPEWLRKRVFQQKGWQRPWHRHFLGLFRRNSMEARWLESSGTRKQG